ncbi:hypothetical protein NliqN6_4339 [Naganishia liquefaciens]|uniref:Uncharacterized protein n=1 Tax=Naganishia liquefaciens TaxID=104408 RepID=A0A8H3TVK3_9TREE|nr:hypothetical protein NliqN6_4339 [Naganishia liquefaciens]
MAPTLALSNPLIARIDRPATSEDESSNTGLIVGVTAIGCLVVVIVAGWVIVRKVRKTKAKIAEARQIVENVKGSVQRGVGKS